MRAVGVAGLMLLIAPAAFASGFPSCEDTLPQAGDVAGLEGRTAYVSLNWCGSVRLLKISGPDLASSEVYLGFDLDRSWSTLTPVTDITGDGLEDVFLANYDPIQNPSIGHPWTRINGTWGAIDADKGTLLWARFAPDDAVSSRFHRSALRPTGTFALIQESEIAPEGLAATHVLMDWVDASDGQTFASRIVPSATPGRAWAPAIMLSEGAQSGAVAVVESLRLRATVTDRIFQRIVAYDAATAAIRWTTEWDPAATAATLLTVPDSTGDGQEDLLVLHRGPTTLVDLLSGVNGERVWRAEFAGTAYQDSLTPDGQLILLAFSESRARTYAINISTGAKVAEDVSPDGWGAIGLTDRSGKSTSEWLVTNQSILEARAITPTPGKLWARPIEGAQYIWLSRGGPLTPSGDPSGLLMTGRPSDHFWQGTISSISRATGAAAWTTALALDTQWEMELGTDLDGDDYPDTIGAMTDFDGKITIFSILSSNGNFTSRALN